MKNKEPLRDKEPMKDSTAGKIVGCICILISIILFICNPDRLIGEMNPLSFFFCCSPLVISLPLWNLKDYD